MLQSEIFETSSSFGTSEFQNWFSGSKLVDAEGRPLCFFHGTSKDQDFKSFKVPENGAWFSTNPKDASEYAEQNDSQGFKWANRGYEPTNTASRVIPVYIRAVNPLYVAGLPDAVRLAGGNGGDPTRAYRKAQKEWFRRVRAEGHDAVVIGGDTVVVLNSPNQIKSAIGNRSFNPTKNGMHESPSASHHRHEA